MICMLLRSTFAFAAGRLRSQRTMRSIVINAKGSIPYGLSNWRQIRRDQFIYVDRTEAIAQLDETTIHSCLWSPRRTGKSLLANQLALWHDKAISMEERTKMFSGTYIERNPSSKAGQYLVLAMDFSVVQDSDIESSFTDMVNAAVSKFSKKYNKAGLLEEDVKIDGNFATTLSNLATVVELSGQTISLVVDEIDSFTNRLLVQVSHKSGLNQSGYHEFVKKEGSVLRDFGRIVKSMSGTCVERIFFTGLMPVAWSDAFSSLNTVLDLSHIKAFENALGFKSSDIEKLLELLFPDIGKEERDKHMESIRNKCNGYRRSSSQVESLYNPQGVWFYLKQLQDKGNRMVPRMDPNIVQPARDELAAFLVKHAIAVQTNSPVHFFDDIIPYTPLQRFSAQSLFDPVQAPNALLSVAHYCGYLSFQYPRHEMYGDVLVAPNDDMKAIFVDAVLDSLPSQYQTKIFELMKKDVSKVVAVKRVYEDYLKPLVNTNI